MRISQHAIQRFRERFPAEGLSDGDVLNKIIEIYSKAKNAKFSNLNYELIALINHNLEPAKYKIFENVVLVIVRNEIKTIHHNDDGRWIEG
jgi:hypothetical protein